MFVEEEQVKGKVRRPRVWEAGGQEPSARLGEVTGSDGERKSGDRGYLF